MRITYDPEKRKRTLDQRKLDFKDAGAVFLGPRITVLDDREDYGETRWITVGWLDRSVVMVVWTERGDARRIISMRKCNDRERKRYEPHLA